ncbi:hypothetical protein CTA2_8992 [Colletotrichum tanaceti]|uniref:Uncharacterized protein n=1 Tax=Colletotrichum tanaceti TaxID=1306861 RepID=A0A4U6X1M7_9PEZI|nr:hypothetical protein CTA2_8992 [Colletotrichum tanaceti]TKW48649.1 hypothetical protein CTA1_652 [Colletotrichum tanaceti]
MSSVTRYPTAQDAIHRDEVTRPLRYRVRECCDTKLALLPTFVVLCPPYAPMCLAENIYYILCGCWDGRHIRWECPRRGDCPDVECSGVFRKPGRCLVCERRRTHQMRVLCPPHFFPRKQHASVATDDDDDDDDDDFDYNLMFLREMLRQTLRNPQGSLPSDAAASSQFRGPWVSHRPGRRIGR